jgi:hypothetical protein
MANPFPPMFFGIDHDRGSVGAANPFIVRNASGKNAREEIARNFAVDCEAKE